MTSGHSAYWRRSALAIVAAVKPEASCSSAPVARASFAARSASSRSRMAATRESSICCSFFAAFRRSANARSTSAMAPLYGLPNLCTLGKTLCMTKAQADAALEQAQLLLAAITEIGERIEAGNINDDVRDELATELWTGAAALSSFAAAVYA